MAMDGNPDFLAALGMHEIGVIQREMNLGRLAVVRHALDAEVVNGRVTGEPADGRLSSDGRAVLSAKIKLERTTVERTTAFEPRPSPWQGHGTGPPTRLHPVGQALATILSAQTAESTPVRSPTLNALNLYRRECRPRRWRRPWRVGRYLADTGPTSPLGSQGRAGSRRLRRCQTIANCSAGGSPPKASRTLTSAPPSIVPAPGRFRLERWLVSSVATALSRRRRLGGGRAP